MPLNCCLSGHIHQVDVGSVSPCDEYWVDGWESRIIEIGRIMLDSTEDRGWIYGSKGVKDKWGEFERIHYVRGSIINHWIPAS